MCNLQDVFERDEEIDGAEWSVFEQAIKMRLDEEGGEREKGGGRERDELDEELVPRVKAKFDTLKGVERRELEHSDYRFQLKKYAALNGDEIVGKFASDTADSTSTSTGSTMTLSSTSTPASKKKRDDGELVVGSASAVVDASIERCAAWAFAEAARLRTKDGDGSHRIRCDERPEDSQSQLVDTAYKLPGGKLLTFTYPDEKNKTTPSKAVARIVKLHKGLSQLSQEYPWIVAFLQEVLKGGLHRNKAVSTKLECLSEAEARRIGKNLPQALRARKTAGAGVLQWKNQNPSMAELFEKHQWAEEMVETMGEELLKNAAWGLWFRVITGSGLSMVDLATDINVILVYFEEGQNGYGWMMLGMVLASMGLQLVLVVMQNWKMGWGKLLREVLIVVSGLKPGVDAMRVVSNAEMHEHHMMTAKIELVFTKGIEMFCESIPGCILQVTALIQGGSREQMATKVLSIIVSAITTGMGSASISYDFDSDPEGRRILPSFYGYLPDDGNKRTIMYFCMVLNSALLLLLRSIGAALLMLVDTKMFVAYMAGDQLLYLLQKLVRGDFLHWVPVEGVGGLAWALLERVIVKTLTDFTGIIQFRAP
ncbi:hypothetical protein TeGR_g12943, partial [Tetraparma gracilis]